MTATEDNMRHESMLIQFTQNINLALVDPMIFCKRAQNTNKQKRKNSKKNRNDKYSIAFTFHRKQFCEMRVAMVNNMHLTH